MIREKKCIHIAYIISVIAWIVSFIFLRGTVLPLALAINLFIETIWEIVLIFFKPRYDGRLVFKVNEKDDKEIWRFELFDPAEEWPKKTQLMIKVETKNDRI